MALGVLWVAHLLVALPVSAGVTPPGGTLGGAWSGIPQGGIPPGGTPWWRSGLYPLVVLGVSPPMALPVVLQMAPLF